jgi:mono/diheme cytochrome c family protein
MDFQRSAYLAVIGLSLFGVGSGCSSPDAGPSGYDMLPEASTGDGSSAASRDAATTDTGTPDVSVPSDGGSRGAAGKCVQALAQSMPARLAVMSGQPTRTDCFVTISQIFQKFSDNCGSCHTVITSGGFSVPMAESLRLAGGEGFASRAEEALWHIRSDGTVAADRDEAMPPLGSAGFKPWTVRRQTTPNDDVSQLSNLLEAWLAAGSPDFFACPMPDAGTSAAGGADGGGPPSAYLMTPAVGNGLTNLGNCIPNRALVGQEQTKSEALDTMFAGLQRTSCADPGSYDCAERVGLPLHLADTDLTTFDGEQLARMGVIAFVPAYPLWSDDAGKLRHVRVPRGQSIHFNKATQEFEIPPNTRFYKTFLKKIVDSDGNPSWRKIETRLIVARTDPDAPLTSPVLDATKINALFGSYRWNDDETEATLITQPLKDQEGFVDTVVEYDTDVNLAASVRASTPAVRQETALERANAIRHYAIPSSQRCIHCHMGSPAKAFVLGFRPVQIRHRPVGEGGIIEPSGPDELSQLDRLIDYGVITGLDSPSDILPLEGSEGDRRPRNDYELTAQGYMVGNCAHCHNPRGFPSVSFPELKDILNFLPSPTGGIFQFPLERVSPRIHRGFAGDIQIPYVTPSLVDHPSFPPDISVASPQYVSTPQWLPKWFQLDLPAAQFVYAPWRSLIYRNVDTSFSYTDDYALYPHMPMDTPGYDNRAKRILGDWMVSIPAARKRPDIPEYLQPYPMGASTVTTLAETPADTSVQPYVEVQTSDPAYANAVADAQQRLLTFHAGTRASENLEVFEGTGYAGRYAYHPDTSDIRDPSVTDCQPVPLETDKVRINVPSHPHWVPLDLTHNAQVWTPANPNWNNVLVDQQIPTAGAVCSNISNDPTDTYNQQAVVVGLLGGITLDPTIRDFASREIPMGLWNEKPECDFSQEPLRSNGLTVDETRQQLSDQNLPSPQWLSGPGGADGQRHVYAEKPGEAVFKMICINCHGPQFDSVGRLAENLATMTGGKAVVADLRHGLFGPSGMPGANRIAAFGQAPPIDGVASEDLADNWGARYMPWMALGGTTAVIPRALMTNVGRSPVFGELRGPIAVPDTPNMLTIAKQLCLQVLSSRPWNTSSKQGYFSEKRNTSFLWDNGDAEMWLKICTLNNPPPVVALLPDIARPASVPARQVDHTDPFLNNLIRSVGGAEVIVVGRDIFNSDQCAAQPGSDSPCLVGDEQGRIGPLSGSSLVPWCVADLKDPVTEVTTWFNTACVGPEGGPCIHPPKCPGTMRDFSVRPPDAWNPQTNGEWNPGGGWDYYWDAQGGHTGRAANAWALRGAINAGQAVFLYLDSVTRGTTLLKPLFDQCNQLAPPMAAPAGDP